MTRLQTFHILRYQNDDHFDFENYILPQNWQTNVSMKFPDKRVPIPTYTIFLPGSYRRAKIKFVTLFRISRKIPSTLSSSPQNFIGQFADRTCFVCGQNSIKKKEQILKCILKIYNGVWLVL